MFRSEASILQAPGATRPATVGTIEDADTPFCYVTTTGRRTGKPHTIEIWFGRMATALYILTFERSDTVRNLRTEPHVRVRVGAQEYRATAREVVRGTPEDAHARRLVVEKYQSAGASDLESWGAGALVVAFDLGAALEDPEPG